MDTMQLHDVHNFLFGFAESLASVAEGTTAYVGVNICEGADNFDERDHTQRVSVYGVIIGPDDARHASDTRLALPVHPDCSWDEEDPDVFIPAYTEVIEAVDGWLQDRGLPFTEAKGAMQVETPALPAEKWAT